MMKNLRNRYLVECFVSGFIAMFLIIILLAFATLSVILMIKAFNLCSMLSVILVVCSIILAISFIFGICLVGALFTIVHNTSQSKGISSQNIETK